MRRIFQVTALLFVALSAYVMVEAHNLHYYTDIGPGAGFFPFWLGGVLALLSLVWLAQVSLRPVAAMEADFIPDQGGKLRLLAILAALVLFNWLLTLLGFRLTMFGFLLFLLVTLGRQNLLVTLTVALVGSFGVDYVFQQWLQVYLPPPSIEFLLNLGL